MDASPVFEKSQTSPAQNTLDTESRLTENEHTSENLDATCNSKINENSPNSEFLQLTPDEISSKVEFIGYGSFGIYYNYD